MYRHLLALLLALLLPVSASALIIDTFDDSATATANSGITPVSTPTAAGSFLGSRNLTATWISGPNDAMGAINSGGSSLLNVNMGASTLGGVKVEWDNIGGVDLTEAGSVLGIGLQIAFDDLAADVHLTVVDSSLGSSTQILALPGGIFVPSNFLLAFAGFVGGADFTDVDSITLEVVTYYPGTDVQIDFIGTPVPEPGTGMLMGFSMLAALGLARRR